jgi:hypothetical protein
MSFFIALIENSDASRRALEAEPRVHGMIHHGLTLAEYRAFLHDLYHIVWHFCPVMAVAAARCGDEFRGVRYALYERIEEERGHEAWVLEDIGAMGGDVSAAAAPPSAPVEAMIAFNYYAAERVHPCSVGQGSCNDASAEGAGVQRERTCLTICVKADVFFFTPGAPSRRPRRLAATSLLRLNL